MTLNPADRDRTDDQLRALFSGPMPRREALAYYLDENLIPGTLIQSLRAAEIPVTSVVARGLSGEPSDFVILSDARQLGCVFVTRDAGYELIHRRLSALPDVSHAGIILFQRIMPVQGIEGILLWLAEKWEDYPASMVSQLIKFG